MIGDEIGQCIGSIDIIDRIIRGDGDIDRYWGDSILIDTDEIIDILNTEDSIREDDWLRSSSFW